MNADFSQLYVELGLQPDCSLDEFKLAYRRRIGELHPDRHGEEQPSEAHLPLKDLIALYAKATRFHHTHGRLPGSASRPAVVNVANAAPAWHAHEPGPAATRAREGESTTTARPTSSRRGMLLAVLSIIALLVLIVSWDWNAPAANKPAADSDIRTDPGAAKIAESTGIVELGMDSATVLAIQGEPVNVRDDQWEYGPSWLRFEEGKLVDWYSSPLYRLKVATPSPRHDAAAALSQ